MKRKQDIPWNQSWTTMKPHVDRAKPSDVLRIMQGERATFKRAYVLERLIAAYTTKIRNQLKKEYMP